MDILDICTRITYEHETHMRANAEHAGKALVANTIATLQDAGRLSRVACDQEWIADYIMGHTLNEAIFDDLVMGWLTAQDIRLWVSDALADLPRSDPPSLPNKHDDEVWGAVKVDGKLYCGGCRSLYEGTPLTESEVESEREEQGMLSCMECGNDL